MKSNKDYRGKFTRKQLDEVLSDTRMTAENKEQMVAYFVDGVRMKDLDISKQAAYSRIRKIIKLLES